MAVMVKPREGSHLLQVQPSLEHRGVFGSGTAPLFPPVGTFEAIGGREAVARLVDGLYDRIEKDKVLRPAFNRDLTRERERVKHFFEAWFGGEQSYFNEGWRQGLKTTHGNVSISRGMADRWIGHFLDSFAEAVIAPDAISRVKPSIIRLAMALVNRANEPAPGERLRDVSNEPHFLGCIQKDDASGMATAAAAHPQMFLPQGPRLLLIASARGKAKAAQELLRQGVNVNTPANLPGSEASVHGLPMLKMTPLCAALAKRRNAVVELLIEAGAQYDIFSAACVGDLDAVRQLLDLAPDLSNACDPASDVASVTPLQHAVFAGQLAVAELLFERGATVGANSVRLVQSVANAGQEALTNLLLAHGADPSSLGAGTWVLYPAIAEKLIARGANVNREPGAWIGMCCTGNSGHRENELLIWAMLRCGADVTARYKGRTALHCAAKAGFVRVAEALIEYGADVNARNEFGRTPLDEVEHAAGSIDREPVRRLLIARSADGFSPAPRRVNRPSG